MNRATIKNVIKPIAFIICLALVLQLADFFLCRNDDAKRSYAQIHDFYEQEDDSLDAILLGASEVYAFYQPLFAWKTTGIKSWDYANSGRIFGVNAYMLKEAIKTQPDAVYVISLTRAISSDSAHVHFVSDNMKTSWNKWQMVNYYCDYGKEAESTLLERVEYMFPLIRYHSRWDDITLTDIKNMSYEDVKGSATYEQFRTVTEDQTENMLTTDERGEPDDSMLEALDEILDICDENNVKAVFVTFPRCFGADEKNFLPACNTLGDIITERGYDYLNLVNCVDEIGIDPTTDYYNWRHANVHGAVKVTKYLAEYLADKYDIADKRNDSDSADWDESYETYMSILADDLTDEDMKILN